jgi:hypothetical protein
MNNFLRNAFSKSNKKKKVSFKSRRTVHTLPQHELVKQEDLWYRQGDSQQIQDENRKLMLMMKSETLRSRMEEQMKHCSRGLESLSVEGKRRAKDNRRECFAVVLSIQQVQIMQGNPNPESIAKAYSRSCISALKCARIMGQLDEQYVRDYVRTEIKVVDDCLSVSSCTETTVMEDDDYTHYSQTSFFDDDADLFSQVTSVP